MKWCLIFMCYIFELAIGWKDEVSQMRIPINVNMINNQSSEAVERGMIKQWKTNEEGNEQEYPSWLNDEDLNSTKPIKVKPEKKPDGFVFNDENNKNEKYDILTKEGQQGWMEKLLKEAKSKKQNKMPSTNRKYINHHKRGKLGNTFYNDIPTTTLTKLTDGLAALGRKATGAKNGLNNLKLQWNDISFGDRAVMTQTLQAAASNLDKFANAGDDPVGAVQGAINMVSQFAALAGPTGQLISVALSFVSGFLSLFGAGSKKQKSVGEIVREEIDAALAQFYETSLANEAKGIVSTFDVSKAYVDHLAQRGQKLTVDQALSLKMSVPLWQGLPLMGTLASEIRNLLQANKQSDAKKVLRYIELYTKIALMKDMVIQETAALMPDELAPNRDALLATQVRLRNTQRRLLKFLYEGDLNSNTMPFFDPDVNVVTDSYLNKILNVSNYDRSLEGIWCLTPGIRDQPSTPITWSREESSLKKDGHPYINLGNSGCFWKLIPHGNYLFTVKNMYKCPDYDHCGEFLNSDAVGDDMKNRVTIEPYPSIWEIYGTQQRRIRTKWGCSSGSQWCNMQLGPQLEAIYSFGFPFSSTRQVLTFGLSKENVGYIWYITKSPLQYN